ncbi:mRNA export factor [Araneus ventricosus]|uniref:mRNA export factor n=1 Tax=Araneus ventricosus TaxID=182803 RepID=A0A4Y2JMX3_ARAVE|nr:mRNA export factor [Araneus ventricosus]
MGLREVHCLRATRGLNQVLATIQALQPHYQSISIANLIDNFTFKCHRSNGTSNGYQDIYAVNDIAFHPVHGTLSIIGSDGRFSFWDRDARTKLKTSEQMDQPLTRCCFNARGEIFAYSVSYDWSKGHEFYNPQKKNYIYLHSCFEELKPRNKK